MAFPPTLTVDLLRKRPDRCTAASNAKRERKRVLFCVPQATPEMDTVSMPLWLQVRGNSFIATGPLPALGST